jgi:calcineurin-like phosphoesterase family protein
MIFFTSDLHINHRAMLKYCPEARPFPHITAMNEAIVERFNSRVGPDDETYFLGDLALNCSASYLNGILSRLHGKKYLIIGNHDKKLVRKETPRKILEAHFEWIKWYHEMKVEGVRLILFHFPIEIWEKKHYGSYHLCGHSHGGYPRKPGVLRMDVGVDTNNLYPYSINEIKSIMEELKKD